MGPDVSQRRKASDFPQGVIDLLIDYAHGRIDRRGFLDGAQKYAIGGVAAAALFDMLKPNPAWAEQVAKSDPRIKSETVTVPSPQGSGAIKGTLATPAKPGTYPVVLVIHDYRGLTPYVEDVARRLAVGNFIAFAGDGLTSLGGYPGNYEDAGKMFYTADREKMVLDFLAAARWLKARPNSTGKLGAVGFCFGGSVVNRLAVIMGNELDAGAPYYGNAPKDEDVAKIKAAILVQHGELDTKLAAGWPAFEAALTKANIPHQGYIYKGANHGFHNDTIPLYDEAAATLSWTRTIAWFNKYLR
ncbi:MAG TPA: dienelactone hydrolase family protein [Caulobacterales bacterium]|jgi:carboxymethylenebutenolidase|nr:dienelactone hydrolase family protein [Caulobacterales bacterium]